jgi:hypothetical protein
MRRRTLIAVGLGTIALVGAAVAPPWLASLGPRAAPAESTVVPFELAGLYVTDCDIERSIRPQPASCSGLYRVGGLTASPAFDPFHRAMYYGYLAGELVPCLRDHGFAVETPSRDAVRGIDVSAWYLTILLQEEAEFDHAIDAWYACPLVPSYLQDSARDGLGVVE